MGPELQEALALLVWSFYVADLRWCKRRCSMVFRSLTEFDINTLEALANTQQIPKPTRGSFESLIRKRAQARIQLEGREQHALRHQLLEPFGAEHGLALLPEPTDDDIFLDFEGHHFTDSGVREYLTGVVTQVNSAYRHTPLWAITVEEEKTAYERFIEVAIDTIERNAGAHIYHFSPYEPAALKRLMSRFASKGPELDTLLRSERFFDRRYRPAHRQSRR